MRKKRERVFATLLVGMMLLTGCQSAAQVVPELLEPLAVNDAYRPVEYGDVGTVDVQFGVMHPQDICHFWQFSIEVSEIKVDVGEYVEQGQVLALADMTGLEEQIADANAAITLEKKLHEQKVIRREAEVQELQYKLKGAKQKKDKKAVKEYKTALQVMQENNSYDERLYKKMLKMLQADLKELEQAKAEGTLIARTSGYVTYVKDISENNMTGPSENVVVISDYEKSYIELNSVTIDQNPFNKYAGCFTYYDGEKVVLEEYAYSESAMLTIQAKQQYPNVRLRFAEPENITTGFEIGSNVPVFFYQNLKEHVLVVGNDSLYEDEVGFFVYVMKGQEKQQRYIEIGNQDAANTEVISGLEEGELVHYSSESVLPASFTPYTVTTADFTLSETSKNYKVQDYETNCVYSEVEGRIKEVFVTERDLVKTGDLICTIETNEGGADIKALSNQIKHLKKSHQEAVSDYEAQIADLKQQMKQAKKDDKQKETSEIDEEQEPYLYQQLSCQIDMVEADLKNCEIQYAYDLRKLQTEYKKMTANNNGNGVVKMFAQCDGEIANMRIKVGKNYTYGERLFNIRIPATKRILLGVVGIGPQLNQEVRFINQDGVSYTGTVTGTTGGLENDSRIYVTELNNQIFVTQNVNDTGNSYYVVQADDSGIFEEEGMEAEYVYGKVVNAVVVPRKSVFTEEDLKQQTLYYVFRIQNDQLVKQYVKILDKASLGNTTDKTIQETMCVISGLHEGDVIAGPVEDKEQK